MTENKTGVIFYCDGSCGPSNPGYMGWGCHGYSYEIKDVTKPFTVDNHLITNKGYLNSVEQNKFNYLEVEPKQYFDIVGSAKELGTNNRAELLALSDCLKLIDTLNIEVINIFTDSEYVVNGISKWCHQWVKHNWVKQDGTPVSNSDLWIDILDTVGKLDKKNVSLDVSWVKGHSDIFGNIKADILATIGMNRSYTGIYQLQVDAEEANVYWSKKIDRHPFLNFNALYFNTLTEHNKPGAYYQSNPGKDLFILGKRLPAASYSVVKLKDPVEVIETIKRKHCKVTGGYNVISVIKLDRVFNSTINPYLHKYLDCAMYRDRKSFNLNFADRIPISLEVNPSGLSVRAIEAFNYLEDLMIDYYGTLEGKEKLKINDYIDITSEFFDTEIKKVKKEDKLVYTLKPTITTAQSELMIEIMYRDLPKPVKIPLTLGLDILPRNNLKKLEPFNPKVILATWQETPDVIRYATIIDCDIGIGLWSNYFCDRILI